jgi:hypothetical protein
MVIIAEKVSITNAGMKEHAVARVERSGQDYIPRADDIYMLSTLFLFLLSCKKPPQIHPLIKGPTKFITETPEKRDSTGSDVRFLRIH